MIFITLLYTFVHGDAKKICAQEMHMGYAQMLAGRSGM